jgi:hypothetical protein
LSFGEGKVGDTRLPHIVILTKTIFNVFARRFVMKRRTTCVLIARSGRTGAANWFGSTENRAGFRSAGGTRTFPCTRSAPLSQGVGLLRLIFDLNHIAPCRDPSALPEDWSEGRGKQQIKFRQFAGPPDSKLSSRVPHAQNQTIRNPDPVDRHTLGIERSGECYPFCLRLMKRGKSDCTQLVILMENYGPNKRHFLAF